MDWTCAYFVSNNIVNYNYMPIAAILALISGISAKIYDDQVDNEIVQSSKRLLDIIRELSVITLVLFMTTDIRTLSAFYGANALNAISNPAGFSGGYELALLLFIPLCFLVVDWSKWMDWELNWASSSLLFCIIGVMVIEPMLPKVGDVEVSVGKLIARSLGVVFVCLVMLLNAWGVVHISSWILPFLTYTLGYLGASVGFQAWMLSTQNNHQA